MLLAQEWLEGRAGNAMQGFPGRRPEDQRWAPFPLPATPPFLACSAFALRARAGLKRPASPNPLRVRAKTPAREKEPLFLGVTRTPFLSHETGSPSLPCPTRVYLPPLHPRGSDDSRKPGTRRASARRPFARISPFRRTYKGGGGGSLSSAASSGQQQDKEDPPTRHPEARLSPGALFPAREPPPRIPPHSHDAGDTGTRRLAYLPGGARSPLPPPSPPAARRHSRRLAIARLRLRPPRQPMSGGGPDPLAPRLAPSSTVPARPRPPAGKGASRPGRGGGGKKKKKAPSLLKGPLPAEDRLAPRRLELAERLLLGLSVPAAAGAAMQRPDQRAKAHNSDCLK